jgi:hypothetical protein
MIDEMIQAGWERASIEPSGKCDDGTFLRRVSLDLIGRVPTSSERAQFMADSGPDKRQRWVDRLLESSQYARHMADLFDVLLLGRASADRMARRAEHGWRAYLQQSFAANRPWNRMARDMVLARATEQTDVRASWFLYERRDAHQDIAESVAPAFFGIRIECAQCHDHPLASEIEQAHYWGLVAFFSRSENKSTDQGPRVIETATGGTKQFTDLAGDSHATQLTFFDSPVIDEPVQASTQAAVATASDDEAKSAEAGNTGGRESPDKESERQASEYLSPVRSEPPVPRFSRRQQFADRILSDHPLLARSMVNRMWALLVGRGFVHPHDRMDSTHPASHTELLDALADDFRASNYDVKRLIRHIVRSRAYQLDSRPADAQARPEHFAFGLTKLLPAESLLRSMLVVLHGNECEPDDELLQEFRAAFPDVLPEESNSNLAQALLLTNHAKLNRLFCVDSSPTLAELSKLPTVCEQVDGAFRAALGRGADADERAQAEEFVGAHADTEAGLAQLLWALLTSTEFRMNH